MGDLRTLLDARAAESGFSGVVRVEGSEGTLIEAAFGLADRAHRIPMRTDTQLGIASGSKAFTALVVMSLVEQSALELDTPARDVLGEDLPLIGPDVTIEHLLAHRSGIGDYLDEDVVTDAAAYVLAVPPHRLVRTEDFLPVLAGFPAKFPAGSGFSYCNGGYVVLALIAERVSGIAYHDLVRQRVCGPAGMLDTDFLRLDALPGRAATGYVHVDGQWRSNVLHLPVVATGDGGIHTTAADLHRFWQALFAGRIVAAATVQQMVRPRSVTEAGRFWYGLGFWLPGGGPQVQLEGEDAGVSFRSRHDPRSGLTWTVIANDAEGAWPVALLLRDWAADPG
jgi:CubicO group peptidase (beta-lactamase class C family)